jgi:hypothetical protein
MNPFGYRLWYAQCDVASLTVVPPPDDKDAGLFFKEIANLVGAQVPHGGNFRHGVMPFNESARLDLRW